MVGPQRLTVREARDEPQLVQRAAELVGASDDDVTALFGQATKRLRELLSLRASPFDLRVTGAIRIDGIAGLLRLSPELELQVVPKFLDPAADSWQEDFFLLALFSQTGRILPREHIRAGHADRGDLAALVGRTLAQMYWEHQRRPVRTYRSRGIVEFSYDGDVDPLDLFVSEPDGFRQNVFQLRRDNEFNAVIATAVRTLLPEVRDAETRKQLLRMQQGLAPQATVRTVRRRALPARHRHWQSAYDLSVAVLQGFGVGFVDEQLLAPGFVLRTWSTWQALVEAALRTGLSGMTSMAQKAFPLGRRTSGPLDVTPDVVLLDAGAPALVVDAKYRTRGAVTPSIEAGDVYETLAFMRAAGTDQAVLLYPRPSSDGPADQVGTTSVFEHVSVGTQQIVGMLVECRGISGADGYGQFARRLADAVRARLP